MKENGRLKSRLLEIQSVEYLKGLREAKVVCDAYTEVLKGSFAQALGVAPHEIMRMCADRIQALMDTASAALSAEPVKAGDRLRKACAAVDVDQNEETEQEFIDALDAYDALTKPPKP